MENKNLFKKNKRGTVDFTIEKMMGLFLSGVCLPRVVSKASTAARVEPHSAV